MNRQTLIVYFHIDNIFDAQFVIFEIIDKKRKIELSKNVTNQLVLFFM